MPTTIDPFHATSDVARARAKLSAKGVDVIVLNTAEGIGGESNRVTLVEARGETDLPLLAKREVAEHILERVVELRGAKEAAPSPAPSAEKLEKAARAASGART